MKALTFLFSLTLIAILGCGTDIEDSEPFASPSRVVANFVHAAPRSGMEISSHATISLFFDNPPTNVSTSHGTVEIIGKMVTINGPFAIGLGQFNLVVTWTDGSQTLTYKVTAPCAPVHPNLRPPEDMLQCN